MRAFSRIPLGPWQATCLYRSVAVCLLLRWSGIDALLRLGAAQGETNPRAHAWVEDANGLVLYGDRSGFETLAFGTAGQGELTARRSS